MKESTYRIGAELPVPDITAPQRRAVWVDAALIAAMGFAALYFPDRDDTSGAILGTIAAFPAAALGLAALRRSRAPRSRSLAGKARYAALALLLGVAAGTANLLVNFGLTQLDPRIRASIMRKITVSSDWSMVVSAPVVEELTFRLLALSGLAWLLGRLLKNRQRIFPLALIVSAILFGFLHIPYPVPFTDTILMAHTAVVLAKSSAAGLLLGWIFWRWGLSYSIACHSAANGIHIVLAPLLF